MQTEYILLHTHVPKGQIWCQVLYAGRYHLYYIPASMRVFFKVVNLKKKVFLKIVLYQNQDSNPDLSDFMVNALKHETIQLLQS